MTKAAREAAFVEERNDALRRSVGLTLPRQKQQSSLARKRRPRCLSRGKGPHIGKFFDEIRDAALKYRRAQPIECH
jgi:hypothetical protein